MASFWGAHVWSWGCRRVFPPVLEHSQNKANPADCVIRRRGSIEWGLDPVPSPAVRRLCDPRRVTILAGLEFLSVDPVTSLDCCGWGWAELHESP